MKPLQSTLAWILLCSVALSVITGCTNGSLGVTPTIPEPSNSPQPTLTVSASPEPTKPKPTGIPSIRVDGGGDLSPIQKQQYLSIEKLFKVFWDYWGKSSNPPINADAWERLTAHIMIDPDDSLSLGVAYEDPAEPGVLITFPWGENGQLLVPPQEYMENGEPLISPLRLADKGQTDNGTPYRLIWQENIWVRADDTGKIIEQINDQGVMEKIQPNIDVAVSTFNLNPERSYSVVDQYLVDGFNQAKMAKWVNGHWVDTTLEEKYGELADLANQPLVNYIRSSGAELGHIGDNRYLQADINVMFTGEIDVVEWEYPPTGEIMRDYRGLVVYRDGDGSVKKFWVSMFSPDIPGLISFRYSYPDRRNTNEGLSFDEVMARYQGPQKWRINFVYEGPLLQLINYNVDSATGLTAKNYNRLAHLRAQQADLVTIFAASLMDDDKQSSTVPDGLVIAPNFLMVDRDVAWENRIEETVGLKVELGIDPQNLVFVDWQDWQTAEFSSPVDEFGPDVVWDKAWGWENPGNGTYSFTFGEEFGGPNPVYRDVNKRPIKFGGFFNTVTPKGKLLLIVRELVKNSNGSVSEWFFGIDISSFPETEQLSLKTSYADGSFFIGPQSLLTEAALDLRKQNPAFGEELCQLADTNPVAKVRQLVLTGSWPDDGKRYLYLPSSGRWQW